MKLICWAPGGADTLYHWCPGCEHLHVIPPKGWTRTGPDESPTYTPSFLQYDAGGNGNNCHYIITVGVLNFCGDCFHSLRNTAVPMPEIPQRVVDKLTDEVFRR